MKYKRNIFKTRNLHVAPPPDHVITCHFGIKTPKLLDLSTSYLAGFWQPCFKGVLMVTKSERKPYEKPQIIHEMDLETRAGSTIGPTGIDPLLNPLEPNPLDLLGLSLNNDS